MEKLNRICREVKFVPIERLTRPLGKARTALESLLAGSGYIADWLRSPAAISAIAELVNRRRYDLAHFDTISLARYRELLPVVPATLGHHNVESHLMRRRAGTEINPLKKLYSGAGDPSPRRLRARAGDPFRRKHSVFRAGRTTA